MAFNIMLGVAGLVWLAQMINAEILPVNLTLLADGPAMYWSADFDKSPISDSMIYTPRPAGYTPDTGFDAAYPGARLHFEYPGGSFCLFGEFDSQVNMSIHSVNNYAPQTYPSDGSVVCANLTTYERQKITVYSGLNMLANLTVTNGLTAPVGAKADDAIVNTLQLVQDGKLTTNPAFTFLNPTNLINATSGEMQLLGSFTVTIPSNTSFVVLRGSGSTDHPINMTMNQPWPEIAGVGSENRDLPSNQYQVDAKSPLIFLPFDPTLQYVLNIQNNYAGSDKTYDISSVDLYSFPAKPTMPEPTAAGNAKAPIGAIVGGVIAGLVVLALLGFGLWWCLRKRKTAPPQSPTPDQKFEIETDDTVMPYVDDSRIHSSADQSDADWINSTVASTSGGGIIVPSSNPKTREAGLHPARSGRRPRHDHDAGAIPMEGEDGDELLPPMYNPSWEGSQRSGTPNRLSLVAPSSTVPESPRASMLLSTEAPSYTAETSRRSMLVSPGATSSSEWPSDEKRPLP